VTVEIQTHFSRTRAIPGASAALGVSSLQFPKQEVSNDPSVSCLTGYS